MFRVREVRYVGETALGTDCRRPRAPSASAILKHELTGCCGPTESASCTARRVLCGRAMREEGEAGLETACMARFRDRRGSADFQALYDLASPALLAWITGQIRSRRVALDPVELLQDAFVNIYRYAQGFR